VCECVVVLRSLKDVSWAGAKAMMADPGFLRSLVEYDKDALTDKQVKKVKDYMKDSSFTYENLKGISTAGSGGLGCNVCRPMSVCNGHAWHEATTCCNFTRQFNERLSTFVGQSRHVQVHDWLLATAKALVAYAFLDLPHTQACSSG
jgi:hypothetical protein